MSQTSTRRRSRRSPVSRTRRLTASYRSARHERGRAGRAFLRMGRRCLADKGEASGYLGHHVRRGPVALHREETAHGEHGPLRNSLPWLRPRQTDDPRRPRRRRSPWDGVKDPGGDQSAAHQGVRLRTRRAPRIPAEGPRPLQQPAHLGRRNPGRARPHPETRPQRALCLTGPAPARHGARAGAPGDGHRGGAALRPSRGRRSTGATGGDTRGRRTFGAGPVRRYRRGPSAGGAHRRTAGSRLRVGMAKSRVLESKHEMLARRDHATWNEVREGTGGGAHMVEKETTIGAAEGLHARPAAEFVHKAKGFSSDIVVVKDGREANAKSPLKLMTLAAKHGEKITIRADGDDAEEAVNTLVELISTEE